MAEYVLKCETRYVGETGVFGYWDHNTYRYNTQSNAKRFGTFADAVMFRSRNGYSREHGTKIVRLVPKFKPGQFVNTGAVVGVVLGRHAHMAIPVDRLDLDATKGDVPVLYSDGSGAWCDSDKLNPGTYEEFISP